MSLRTTTVAGVKWTSAVSFISAGLNFIRVLFLARVLAPADFGLAAIATAVLGILQIFADLGVGAAIVQRPEVSQRQLSALFWITVALSLVLAGGFILLIQPLARFYAAPDLGPLLLLASGVLPVGAVGAIPVLLLQRRLSFLALAISDVVSATVNAGVAIAAALLGMGAASIVLGLLVGTGVRSILVIAVEWEHFRPRGQWGLGDARSFLAFGLFQIGDRLLRGFATRIDQILIGKFLGTTDLGYYSLAYGLVIQPVARLASVVTRVTLPVYAKMQAELDRLARAFGGVLESLSTALVPLMVFLVAFATPVVTVLYDPRWQPSAPLLQLLAVAAMLWTVDYPTVTLQVSLGRAGLSFAWSGIVLVLTALGIVIGARSGIRGVALGILLAWAVVYVIEYFFVVRRLVTLSARVYFWDVIAVPVLISLASGAVALAVTVAAVRPSVQVPLGAALFTASYVVLLRVLRPSLAARLFSLVRLRSGADTG